MSGSPAGLTQAHHAGALRLAILSGGAADGLVSALAPRFMAATGFQPAGHFGAVGAMRDKLLSGEPADLLILTQAIIADLIRGGHAVPGSAVDLGIVRTAVAVRANDAMPDVASPEALKAALAAADEIYLPDPKLATAGIHFADVLEKLGLTGDVAPRLRAHPNGQTAMRAMAASTAKRPIGCTQVTEILSTPGVTLVAALPKAFELATVYTAAVATHAVAPDIARRFVRLLSAQETRDVRHKVGFEDA